MSTLMNDRFLRACRRESVDRPPVWLMRQAGRYMPEYRALREGTEFLEFCKTPELCCQAAMLPIEMLGVDAAILFADILPLLEGMGADLDYIAGRGPVINNPIRRARDVEALSVGDPLVDSRYAIDAVSLIKRELDGRVPLIGFAGAPFTLASYLIEGGGSKDYRRTKYLMYREPQVFGELLDKIARTVGPYLAAQVDAGADAIQLFDSWAGALGPADYARFAGYYARKALELVAGRVPTILYVNGAGTLLDEMVDVGADVIGVDFRIELDQVRQRIGWDVAVQGNLDPCILYGPPEVIAQRTTALIRAHGSRPGQIVNLGSGILPDVPVPHARAFVDAVVHHTWEDDG